MKLLYVVYLYNEINVGLRVQPEVDDGPFAVLPLVLLLHDEHVVEVDAQLLRAVELQ